MISINVIPDTQESITLQDWNTAKKYDCKLITLNRGPNEKYLEEDWNKFLKDSKLRQGDSLVFDLEDPPNSLFVEIVRQKGRH